MGSDERFEGFSLAVDDSLDPPAVVATGELDLDAADPFRRVLFDLVDQGHQDLELDLGGLSFMDSTGLNALILVRRRLSGTLVLVNPPPTVVRMLEATSLTDMFALR